VFTPDPPRGLQTAPMPWPPLDDMSCVELKMYWAVREEATLRELPLEELKSDDIHAALWERVEAAYRTKELEVGRDLLALPLEVVAQVVPPAALAEIEQAEGDERAARAGQAVLGPIERNLMLQVVDGQWKDHLYSLDHLKEGIGLRGYGQRDPLVEYKKESFKLFRDMKQRVDEETVRYLWRLRPVFSPARPAPGAEAPAVARPAAPSGIFAPPRPSQMQENRPAPASSVSAAAARATAPRGGIFGGSSSGAAATAAATAPVPARVGGDDVARTVRREEPKVGRNDPCPCGSGKKYKKCHGAGL